MVFAGELVLRVEVGWLAGLEVCFGWDLFCWFGAGSDFFCEFVAGVEGEGLAGFLAVAPARICFSISLAEDTGPQ